MATMIAPVPQGTLGAAWTRGVLFVHSCTRALSPHVEWALAQVLEREVSLRWDLQPILPGTVRTEFNWQGEAGTAARLVSSLRGFTGLRLEVTEEPSPGREGERYSVTPNLGIHRSAIGPHGDVVLSEDRIRAAMAHAAGTGTSLRDELDSLLGARWDDELEPFRYAGQGAQVRYLHRVG